MYAIIWPALIGVIAWSIANMAGQHQYAQILAADPSALEIMLGIVVTGVATLFLHTSSTR
jgi:hypothetical protein